MNNIELALMVKGNSFSAYCILLSFSKSSDKLTTLTIAIKHLAHFWCK